jgi:proteasome lid subunit RPN8/RPN11
LVEEFRTSEVAGTTGREFARCFYGGYGGNRGDATAQPRKVFCMAVIAAMYAIALMHNHPSGECDPSDADRRIKGASTMLRGIWLDCHVSKASIPARPHGNCLPLKHNCDETTFAMQMQAPYLKK